MSHHDVPLDVPLETAAGTSASAATTATATPPLTPTEQSLLEKLVLAQLEDKRRARFWGRIRWGLFILVVLGFVFFDKGCGNRAVSTPHTAQVEIKGEIMSGSDASAQNLLESLTNAFKEPSAQAVVLLINSPGGSPVQAGIINDEIHRLKALYKKPVYAVVEESCTSAAYYIAVAADRIYADKASIVGSIGVLMDGFGFTGLMNKVGVERRLLTAGENKGFLDPFSPMNADQKAYAQEMLDEVHEQFIDVVRKGRGARLHESPELFSGLFWSGTQAMQMGLIDDLANVEKVAREVVKAEEIIDYTHHENVAEKLAKRFGASVGAGAMRAMRERGNDLR